MSTDNQNFNPENSHTSSSHCNYYHVHHLHHSQSNSFLNHHTTYNPYSSVEMDHNNLHADNRPHSGSMPGSLQNFHTQHTHMACPTSNAMNSGNCIRAMNANQNFGVPTTCANHIASAQHDSSICRSHQSSTSSNSQTNPNNSQISGNTSGHGSINSSVESDTLTAQTKAHLVTKTDPSFDNLSHNIENENNSQHVIYSTNENLNLIHGHHNSDHVQMIHQNQINHHHLQS